METIIFILKSIVLGIVEGITEFLPISSTGHLIIFQNLLNFESVSPNYVIMYTYVIQLGAIFAVIVLYRKKIIETIINLFPKKVGFEKSGLRFWLIIVLACIPGGFFGILLGDFLDKYLFNPTTVALALFFGGIFMIYAENKLRDKNSEQQSIDDVIVTPKQALIVGFFQCLALIPGMSRSASTIIGGWVAGFSTVLAAEFSFFLSIPIMFGMSFLKIVKIGGLGTITGLEIWALVVGFAVSFGVALVVIDRLINYLKKKPMKIFAYYRMIFAVVVIIAGVFNLI